MRVALGSTTLVLLGCAATARGQGIADRVAAVSDGTVRLAYNVRPGICGDGETFIRDRARGENSFYTMESTTRRGRNWRDQPCEPGPARVAITKIDGAVTRVKVYVGGDWPAAGGNITDLGAIAAPLAAQALITIAGQGRRADDAIFGAVIADSAVVWPELLALAKQDGAPRESRKSAVFWLSQAAGDAATKGLSDLAEDEGEDREVRDQAVFALSQLPDDQGIPILIRLAKSNKDPKIRRKAIFWLGQSDDPRALALFEELLTKG
jgi:hypothetical protein